MKNNKKKGFTLVELLVVIAILAILATVSVVGYTAFIERATVSNDENVAAQLNQFLVAVKNDSNGPFYGKDINEDNILELTEYILDESGYGELIPQAEKYGYHFYFDLTEDKYVVIGDKDERILAMSPLGRLLAHAAGEATSKYPESCFTQGGNYFLVESGTKLADLIAGYKSIASAQDLIDYNKAVSEYKNDAKQSLTGLIDLVKGTVFATPEGYLVVEDGEHDVLFVPTTLEGVKLSGVKVNVCNENSRKSIGTDNPLVTLGEKSVFTIPTPEKIYAYSLWFNEVGEHEYSHYNNADGTPKDEYKTTLKFDLTLDQIKEIADLKFTNVVFELSDGEQYGFIGNSIVLLRDRSQSVGVTTQVAVTSFTIGIEGKTEVGKFLVPRDQVATTYKMVADNFLSNDELNPTNVPDKTVKWALVDAPAGVEIDADTGVITGICAGVIKVQAQSVLTPGVYSEVFEIRVGAINDVAFTYKNGSTTKSVIFATGSTVSHTIDHEIVVDGNDEFVFTVEPKYLLPDVTTDCDDTFTWTISGDESQRTFNVNQDNNTVTINFKKAGEYTIEFSYEKYPEVVRTIKINVTNVVTAFEVGYLKGGNPFTTPGYDYVDFNSLTPTTVFDMAVFGATSDGYTGEIDNSRITWTILAPNGDRIETTDGKFTPTTAGAYTITAYVDGNAEVTRSFTLYVSKPEHFEIYFNGATSYLPLMAQAGGYAAKTTIKMSAEPMEVAIRVGVTYSQGVDKGYINPQISVESGDATYDNGRLTINKAGTVVLKITSDISGYDSMTTLLTITVENTVDTFTATPNGGANQFVSGNTIYISPNFGIGNTFSVNANFTFVYTQDGDPVLPKMTWSVEEGEEFLKSLDEVGASTGEFELIASPTADDVIVIKATPDDYEDMAQTITVKVADVAGFELNVTDINKDSNNPSDTYLSDKGDVIDIFLAYTHTDSFTINAGDFHFNGLADNTFTSGIECEITSGDAVVEVSENTFKPKSGATSTEATITVSAFGKTRTIKVYVVKPDEAKLTFGGKTYTIDNNAITYPIVLEYTAADSGEYPMTLVYTGYNYDNHGLKFDVPSVTPVELTDDNGLLTVGADKITIVKAHGEFSFQYTIPVDGFATQTFEVSAANKANLFTPRHEKYNNLPGTVLNNEGKVVTYGSIVVGNSGEIPIAGLFERLATNTDATTGTLKVKIEYNLNQSDRGELIDATAGTVEWAYDATSGFSGTFTIPADVPLSDNNHIYIHVGYETADGYYSNRVKVQYIAGVNVDEASEWKSDNANNKAMVLLSNITTTSKITVTSGTIYGNNFVVTATGIANTSSETAAIKLSDGHIKNLILNGPTYSSINVGGALSSNAFGIQSVSGTNTITNSYAYGFAAPVIVTSNLTITNSVIEGGNLCNIYGDIGANAELILDSAVTIQNRNGYSGIYGLGIFIDTNAVMDITFKGNTRQYNWICKNDGGNLSGYAPSIISDLFGSRKNTLNNAGAIHTDANGTEFINMGIIHDHTNYSDSGQPPFTTCKSDIEVKMDGYTNLFKYNSSAQNLAGTYLPSFLGGYPISKNYHVWSYLKGTSPCCASQCKHENVAMYPYNGYTGTTDYTNYIASITNK